jgi:hypothetical protein
MTSSAYQRGENGAGKMGRSEYFAERAPKLTRLFSAWLATAR